MQILACSYRVLSSEFKRIGREYKRKISYVKFNQILIILNFVGLKKVIEFLPNGN